MKRIYLLQPYKEYGMNEIIDVSNNVALGLIDSGVARECSNRDFLVKPEFGIAKAFRKSPSKTKKDYKNY